MSRMQIRFSVRKGVTALLGVIAFHQVVESEGFSACNTWTLLTHDNCRFCPLHMSLEAKAVTVTQSKQSRPQYTCTVGQSMQASSTMRDVLPSS